MIDRICVLGKYLNFFKKILLANLGLLKQPYKVFLVVTKSCHSQCLNCQIWKEVPRNELTIREYELLAKNIGIHMSWLNISGGEPTDRDDLCEIIEIFIKNCPNLLIINFTSNGLNVEKLTKVAHFLNNSSIPIIGINVSIDGPEELHIKLRGGNNSYKNAIKSLRALMQFNRLKIHACMTLCFENVNKIQETFNQLKFQIPEFRWENLHLNYPFNSQHYYKNEHVNVSIGNKGLVFPNGNDYNVKKSILGLIKFFYYKKLIKFKLTKITPIQCSAIRSNIYISEHGEVFPCTIWAHKLDSLRANGFDLKKILIGSEAINLKKKIKEKDCPNCWSSCEAFPSILDNLGKIIYENIKKN